MRNKRALALLLCVTLLVSAAALLPSAATTLDGVTPWNTGDTIDTANNWLTTATTETSVSSNANGGHPNNLTKLTDGSATSKASYYLKDKEANHADIKNVLTDEAVVGTSGMAQLAFKLSEYVAVEQVLLIGSPSDNAAGTWSYTGESSAQGYWGTNYKLHTDGRYHGTDAAGNIRTYNDKNLLYYEVYVADSADSLFHAANRVLVYDNTQTLYQGATHTLTTPAKGQYVGFRIPSGTSTQARIGELGVYGYKTDRLITGWNTGDTIDTANNWLTTATTETSVSSNANGGHPNNLTKLTDGSATSKASYYLKDKEANHADIKNVLTGEAVVGTSGMAQLAFKLSEYVAVEQVLLIGSPSDNAAGTWSYTGEGAAQGYWGTDYKLHTDNRYHGTDGSGNIRTYNDKNLLYYEVYVSNSLAKLFDESSRVLVYDNTATLYQGATHKLETPVTGQYVGFRIPTGTSTQARIGELGVYGTRQDPPDPYTTPWNNGDAINTADNLLSGSAFVQTQTSNANPKLADAMVALLDGTADNKASFYVKGHEPGYTDYINPVTGQPVKGTTGYVQMMFKMTDYKSVEKVFIAGSPKDSNKATWDYASEDSAKQWWGEGGYVKQGDRYYAADDEGNIRYFNNRQLQYYEVYVSDYPAQLFKEENRVLSYDNSQNGYDGALHTLKTAVKGQYIGFRVTAGTGTQARIGEIAVYGSDATRADTSTVPWNAGDAIDRENNLLTTAERQRDNAVGEALASNLGPGAPDNASDGTATEKACYYTFAADADKTYGEAIHPVTGQPIAGTTGWARVAFKLKDYTAVEKVMVLGSPKDSDKTLWDYASEDTAKQWWGDNYTLNNNRYAAAYADGTVRYFNNRQVQYYEVYVSDSFDTLFDKSHLVLSYDNTMPLYDGATHTLEEAVEGQFVGFRATTGANTQVRFGELGIYGSKVDKDISFTTTTAAGKTVTLTVSANSSADRDALKEKLGGIRVTETALPASVNKNINNNWLTVDDSIVYRVQLLDQVGGVFPDTATASTDGLNGRAVQISITSDAEHLQTFGELENGAVKRLMNAYKKNGVVYAGVLNYPDYGALPNNRDKVVISTGDISLVMLRFNDLDTINALNGTVVNTPLDAFRPAGVA